MLLLILLQQVLFRGDENKRIGQTILGLHPSKSAIGTFIQLVSIGIINTLFSLFHQEKKEIREAARYWNTRNLTDFRRHAQ